MAANGIVQVDLRDEVLAGAAGGAAIPFQSSLTSATRRWSDARATARELASGVARASQWQRPYVALLIILDAVALMTASLVGLQFPFVSVGVEPIPTTLASTNITYLSLLPFGVIGWWLAMAANGAYRARYLGLGSEEFRRVTGAGVNFVAAVALVSLAFQVFPARRYLATALPLAVLLTVLLRYVARKSLHSVRRSGRASHRVLVVGEPVDRAALLDRIAKAPYAGLVVVGTASPQQDADGRPTLEHVPDHARHVEADTIAVAHSPMVTAEALRRMAWSLEGSGTNLLLAPALTDVAGPRVHVRPLSGLPLLQIAEPEFSGFGRFVKGAIDRVGSLILLLVAAPVLIAAAVAVKLDSPGPVIFRQRRVGQDGRDFTMFKLRSMHTDAERIRQSLLALNDHGDDGVMFKMVDDPRITRVGRWLRRFSIDELPQLFNVLIGTMSLVGPRPPLPDEVERYEPDAHRRLLVKPGLTGLWQVSGRSDLAWDETVRLDLYYVENWSVALDVEILWKTLFAVFAARGAR